MHISFIILFIAFFLILFKLTSAPSMFAAMFSRRSELTKPNDKGEYFFDRDPTHFRYILNYLRTSKIILPESKRELQELLLEAEYFSVDDLKEAIQRALGGLRFEENFQNFNVNNGHWKEAPIKTYTHLDEGKPPAKYLGFPLTLSPTIIDSRTALRMKSILGPMERRAMCTTECFGNDALRTEVKIRTMPDSDRSSDSSKYYIIFFVLYYDCFVYEFFNYYLIFLPNFGVIFEVYLWNPTTEEYIGVYLYAEDDAGRNKSMHIVCHENGHNKEKPVDGVWDYEQDVTILIQSLQDKTEVRISGSRRKTFHVPVALERLAPFHVVIGQRTDNSKLQRVCDVALWRVAVFG